jgi:hypothetical protein
MKNIIFLCIRIIVVGYSKNTSQSNSLNINDIQINNDEIIEIQRNEIIEIQSIEEIKNNGLKDGEEKLQHFGIVLNSIINEDNVNIHLYPSFNSDVLLKIKKDTKIIVIGISKDIDEIDGYIGHWLFIKIGDLWGDDGWIFSKYVENIQIIASELDIIELPRRRGDYSLRLNGIYEIDGRQIIVELSPNKVEYQNFYTFAYDYNNKNFHYSNIPGTYVWYPETNEFIHISYIGTGMESAWVKLTDNLNILFMILEQVLVQED